MSKILLELPDELREWVNKRSFEKGIGKAAYIRHCILLEKGAAARAAFGDWVSRLPQPGKGCLAVDPFGAERHTRTVPLPLLPSPIVTNLAKRKA